MPYVSSPQVANFIGFFIVFVGCIILGALTSAIISRFVKTAGLSWFDHSLGAVFGVIRGTLLGLAVITALVAFAPAVASRLGSGRRRGVTNRTLRRCGVELFSCNRAARDER